MTTSIGEAVAGWTQLSVLTVSACAEACADLLWELGSEGVQVDDCAVVLDQSEDAALAPSERVTVTGYISDSSRARDAAAALREALRTGALAGQLQVSAVAEQDWALSWRDNFPPLRIGRFLIVPPWAQPGDADGAVVVSIDPGLAFGTGQHPTTHMCLELLGERLPGMGQSVSVLDVGCGSGVLSIAAARLGATVTASDLDPFCVRATRDNARANGVEVQVVRAAGLDWTDFGFDLVIANLMSALLMGLAGGLARVTRPGATLIVSGISQPRALEVEAALNQAGYLTLERRDMDGDVRGDFTERWVAFVLQRCAEVV